MASTFDGEGATEEFGDEERGGDMGGGSWLYAAFRPGL